MKRIPFSIFLLFFATQGIAQMSTEQTLALVQSSLDAIAKLKTVECRLARYERFGTQFNRGELDMKVQVNPRKLYLKNSYPDAGSEVLWVNGWNDNKAYVHPNRFPWFNLSFDPKSGTLMSNQHHSMHQLGFSFFAMIVQDALNRHKYDAEKYVKYKGIQKFDGRTCHLIVIDYSDYKWINYTVKANETLWDLEQRLVIPAYMVMERNGLSSFESIKEGMVIQIPNVYARLSRIWIDQETLMPVIMEVSDDKGIFERYEYYRLRINTPVAPDEFTPNFAGYGF